MVWPSCSGIPSFLVLGLFCLALQECSSLGEPDLFVQVGYWAYVLYSVEFWVNDPTEFPTGADWEYLMTFEAYSVHATTLPENSDTTFTCLHQCFKYSNEYYGRVVLMDSEAAVAADESCLDVGTSGNYQPMCFPDDVSSRTDFERLVFAEWWWPGYYSATHTNWAQPKQSLPSGHSYSVGGNFTHTTPMVPSEAAERDLTDINLWNVSFNVWARINLSVFDTVCYGGFQMSNVSGNCEACSIGTYRPITQRTGGDCLVCPQNSTGSGAGDLDPSACVCDSGFRASTTTTDVSPEVLEGRTTEKVCAPCSEGTYGLDEECLACPAGSYAAELGQASCTATAPGYFQPEEGASESLPCQAGTYSLWSGATTCDDCAEGYYGESAGMSRCEAAPAGYFTNGTGSTEVLPCSAGTYRTEGGDGGSCSPCPAGSYSALEAATFCLFASPGYFASEAGQTEALACSPGSYSNTTGSTTCIDCEPGSFVNASAATSCQFTNPGYYQDLAGQTQELPCSAGNFSAASGADLCDPCPAGSYAADDAASICTAAVPGYYQDQIGQTESLACAPGTFSGSSGSGLCTECAAGSFANASGSSGCFECSEGHFQDLTGQTEQLPCPPGSYGPSTGMATCVPCDPGQHQTQYGQVRCEICPRGTYANESTTYDLNYSFQIGAIICDDCPASSTTNEVGSQSMDACICPVGSWGEKTTCTACTKGMLCNEAGLSLPQQGAGYMVVIRNSRRLRRTSDVSSTDMEFDIWKCLDSTACPSGPASTCGANRDPSEIACGKCLDGFHLDSESNCVACSSLQATLILLAVCTIACAILVGLAFLANRHLVTQASTVKLFFTCLGMAVVAFQIMSVFVSLSVTWRDPLKFCLESLSFMSLDLTKINADCILGSDVPILYASRQLSPIVASFLLGIILACKKRWYNREFRLHEEFVNIVGAATQMLFVAILTSITIPFICYDHPNGMSSMVRNPEILCFEDSGHYAMVGTSIAAFCTVVVPFVGLVLHGVLGLPAAKRSSRSMTVHLRLFKFLFLQYEPHAYYFGVISLIRGLLICLVPVVIRDEGAAQVPTIAAIMLAFQICVRCIQPWSSKFANGLDGAITAFLILMLACVQLAENPDEEYNNDLLGTLSVVCFICAITTITLVLLFNSRWYMRPHLFWPYFLTHHKADAATQARFLQLTFAQKTGKSCFLDSDHLRNLDKLFDVVRGNIQYLIVFLTSDTLKRPWCAGEVTVAFLTHRRAIPVYTPSFQKPPEDEISATNILKYIAQADYALSDYGLGEEALSDAFRWFLSDSMPMVKMRTNVGSRLGLEGIVEDCIVLSNGTRITSEGKSGRRSRASVASSVQQVSSGTVVISADPEDAEACAGAGIVMLKLYQRVAEAGIQGMTMLHELPNLDVADLEEVPLRAQSLIIVLSEGSLKLDMQLYLIAETMKAIDTGISVVPLTLPSFRFPTQSYFSEYLPNRFGAEAALLNSSLKVFFRRIAVQFATSSSSQVLDAQAIIIFDRLDMSYTGRRSGKTNRENSTTKTVSEDWAVGLRTSSSSRGPPEHGLHASDTDASSDTLSLASL